MPGHPKQVMLPFAALPTTECVRNACANVIRDIERDHDLTDQQLAEAIGVHVNTISRARNKLVTIDNLTLARIAAVFGQDALGPWHALGLGMAPNDAAEPIQPMALATAAIATARGAKAEFDALPVAKDAHEALGAWIASVERKRLRAVA